MDPYLEGEMWQEFHETLASAIRAQLMPRLAPKYVGLLAKRYSLMRPALGMVDLPPGVVYPDVPLDMQATVQACFDLVGYERLLDYPSPPPPPELNSADTAWVDGLLHAAGYRSASPQP